jgi:aryl-alcohol dehydrogenase-like predicted oxidoreductase
VYQLHNPRMDAIRSDELFATLEDLVAEGKVRSYGVGLGPKIGWRDEGLAALATRPITSLTMIHNVLEQDPGRDLIAAAREADTGLFVRVPHSSGMLEGKYTTETTFPPTDHRSHRPRSWLLEGLQKIETLGFLTHERPHTLAQASLKWLLAEPLVMTTLPNIYGPEQLDEFAAAPDMPDLDKADLARVAELYAADFGVRPEAPTPA